MNLKYAFSNLSRKPLFVILTVLQLIASVLILYSSIAYESYFTSKAKMMTQVFENRNLYSIKLDYAPDLNKISKTNLEHFHNFINTVRDFTYISVEDANLYINTSKQNEDFVKAYAPKYINNEYYELVYQLVVNNNFFSKFNFELDQGKVFKEEDFNVRDDKPIPIILGNSYSNIYKVGDIIRYLDNYNKPRYLQVKGFLKRGYYFADGSNIMNMNNLDKYIIFPRQPIIFHNNAHSKYDEDFYKINLINSTLYGFIDLNNKNNSKSDDIVKEIASMGEKCNLDIKITNLDETISNFIETNNKLIFTIKVLFIIIFIFTAVGIVASLNYSILRHYKEFGVHIMHGAQLWDIAIRIFYEIGILFTIADICLINIIHIFFNGNVILQFNADYFLITVMICIILAVLLSLIPVIKVLNLQITDLIRGDE